MSTEDNTLSKERIEERKHLRKIVFHLNSYYVYHQWGIQVLEDDFESISKEFKKLVPDFYNKLNGMNKCIKLNQNFLRHVTDTTYHIFGDVPSVKPDGNVSTFLMGKIDSTLRQCAREWSKEGIAEREQCYGPILHAIEKHFPDLKMRNKVSVLVPGCGLGRLVWEFSHRGFNCEGNEFTYFMLLTAALIMHGRVSGQYRIFPFATETKNVISAKEQLRQVVIPDVNPANVPNDLPKITQGDFLQLYGHDTDPISNNQKWDVIVTCFFIDTAANILTYIRRIVKILKPNGIWVNLGPLLYHYGTNDFKGGMGKKKKESCSFSRIILRRTKGNIPGIWSAYDRRKASASMYICC